MRSRWLPLLLLAPCFVLSSAERAASPAQPAAVPAPAYNWVLPLFTDKEGYRTMIARGTNARPEPDGSLFVQDLHITLFSGTADARVDTVLLSPEAKFFPKENRASGDKAVRLIRDDAEITGEGWTYDHAAKKVSLHRNVRVVFKAPLNEFLK